MLNTQTYTDTQKKIIANLDYCLDNIHDFKKGDRANIVTQNFVKDELKCSNLHDILIKDLKKQYNFDQLEINSGFKDLYGQSSDFIIERSDMEEKIFRKLILQQKIYANGLNCQNPKILKIYARKRDENKTNALFLCETNNEFHIIQSEKENTDTKLLKEIKSRFIDKNIPIVLDTLPKIFNKSFRSKLMENISKSDKLTDNFPYVYDWDPAIRDRTKKKEKFYLKGAKIREIFTDETYSVLKNLTKKYISIIPIEELKTKSLDNLYFTISKNKKFNDYRMLLLFRTKKENTNLISINYNNQNRNFKLPDPTVFSKSSDNIIYEGFIICIK